jgi:hypothetical protein
MKNEPLPLKKCTRCHRTKKLSNYHRDRSAHDGLTTMCKPCRLTSVAANRANQRGKKHFNLMFDLALLKNNLTAEFTSKLEQYEGKVKHDIEFYTVEHVKRIDIIFQGIDARVAKLEEKTSELNNTCAVVNKSLNTITTEEQFIIGTVFLLAVIGFVHSLVDLYTFFF